MQYVLLLLHILYYSWSWTDLFYTSMLDKKADSDILHVLIAAWYGNEASGSMKGSEFDKSYYSFLKDDSAPWH
jgi:hypothetical protein